ncbi:MAG: LysM peptidoglycan-binding domain-containing protein [Winogradskyella sp.]|nr:LysM peptidoglycan-binding domain-containing protein [Winogradskyella sp.]
MKRIFTLTILLLLSFKLLIAQDKFIQHTVVKGESVYAISKKYGVTINSIYEFNPNATDIIYPGEILRIPDGNSKNTAEDTASFDNSDLVNYTVKRGETKFGLSKRFGVSIAILEQQNPQIVPMLMAGHVLKIDKTKSSNPKKSNSNEHVVLKGETLWGISKQYNVALNALISANSNDLSEFLQIGQILTIPDENAINQTLPENEYIVQRGETKYGLAKRFNMTIATLEAKNPQIVPMLMAGHKLDISSTIVSNEPSTVIATIEEEQEPETNTSEITEDLVETSDAKKNEIPTENNAEKFYEDYVIQPKETLYSLSKKANLTIGQLYNLNPKLLTAVNKGDTIKMPLASKQVVNTSEGIAPKPLDPSPPKVIEKNTSFVSNLDFSEKNGIYFYLPFSEREFNSSRYRQKSANQDLQKYFEFYEGAQMAMDAAKALNLKFDISLIAHKDETESKFEIVVDNANTENAIVVPFLENNGQYPEIISNKKVPIIDVESNLSTYPNTTIYKSIPSDQFQKTKTLDYLARKKNVNIVVISTTEGASDKDLISTILPDAKFLNVDNAGFFNTNELNNALKRDQLNYVILDSQQTIIFLNTTTSLMGKLSEYNIQLVLINSDLLAKQNEASKMRYKILKLIYPTLALNENLQDLRDFERKYELLHKTKPSMNAVLGYDVVLDVLLRLSQKASFETSVNTILNSEQTHLRFDYQKTNSDNYSNIAVYLMQYDAIDGIIRID